MLKKEQILKILKKYGFYSLNRAPYLYQNKEDAGVYFVWSNKHYGNLERVLYFQEEESLEEEVFKYYWYLNHKSKLTIEVEFDNYEVLNPTVFYKYNGTVLTSQLMKNFNESKDNFEDPKEVLKKKQLLRTANILILVLKEKFKNQNETYNKVEEMSEKLKKLTNTYNKKLSEYKKENEQIEEAYEILMNNQDESEKLVNALYDELATLDQVDDIRNFIKNIFTYLSDLEMNESHLQNVYLLNRYPVEIEDMQNKIKILEEALKAKKRIFKSKIDVMKKITEIENNSLCKKMVNINVYIDKEKKQILAKYENCESIDETVLGDYFVNFEKMTLELPPMIEKDISVEELNKDELIEKLKANFNKLTKKEKSACYVASSFLKDCLHILIQKDALHELDIHELISKIIVDKQLDLFEESYQILDHYLNAKIRVKYFSILKTNDFETFMYSLVDTIRILNNLNMHLESSFYGYYNDKNKSIIPIYLKNIFNYKEGDSYIATISPNVSIYYSPINIIKQLDIVDHNELLERENDTIFLLKEKIYCKTKENKVVVAKYEKDKIIKRKDYVVITDMKEKNRCSYYEDMVYNKEDGGLYESE